MEYIDIETWDRKDYFNEYLGTDFPYINVGANLDITNLLGFCKKRDLPFYLSMVFSAHHIASQITNFKYRIKDGRPILNDKIHASFTHLPKDRDLFIIVTPEYIDEIMGFLKNARELIAKQGTDLGLNLASRKIRYHCLFRYSLDTIYAFYKNHRKNRRRFQSEDNLG